MNLKEFQEQAIKTESVVENVEVNLQYLSSVLQILIGAGNLLDQIKKNVFYDKPILKEDRAEHTANIIEAVDGLFANDPNTTEIMKTNSRLFHSIVGIATESTELLENLVEHNIDIINMLEEAGDVGYYISIMHDEVDANWETTHETIINKLKKRYPDKFNSNDAINRNIEAEREILETMSHNNSTTNEKID